MGAIRSLFSRSGEDFPVRAAVCMSGKGSNAEVLLRFSARPDAGFRVAVIFTDAPSSSRARELAETYHVPFASLDIRRFYAEHGEESIRLDSPRRREIRDLWSDEVYRIISGYHCGFAVFAGFVPLTNLADRMPCLNVHPGDLTVEEGGRRIYAGLHCEPVERALLDGRTFLRSSVILVGGYRGDGAKDVDGGPVLGISEPMPVDLAGHTVEELRVIRAGRTAPPFHDELRRVALENIEKLKVSGDHVVFPQVLSLFARGCYGCGDDGITRFRETEDSPWQPVRSVEFSASRAPRPIPCAVPAGKTRRNRLIRYGKYLYAKIVRDNGSPDYIARGWALGMFIGCVIPVFCQLIISVPLSFVFRGSKIGAALGTFITTPPTAIFIYPVQIWVGNRIIDGDLSAHAAGDLLRIFSDESLSFAGKWSAFAAMGWDLVAAFFAGGLLWAAVMTPLTYFGVRQLVVRYRRIRAARSGGGRR